MLRRSLRRVAPSLRPPRDDRAGQQRGHDPCASEEPGDDDPRRRHLAVLAMGAGGDGGEARDAVVQRLFAAGLSLRVAMASAVGRQLDELERATDQVDGAIRELRRAAFGQRAIDVIGAGAPEPLGERPAQPAAPRLRLHQGG